MSSPRIRKLPAIVLLVGALTGGAHMAATLAFTGPDTPLKQSMQPHLNRYFLGPLDQGWNLFAPGIFSQDENMLVRACIGEADVCAGGQAAGAVFTEWRNVSAEQTPKDGLPRILANREHRQAKVIHGRFWPAAADLAPEFRRMAEANHLDGEPVFGVGLGSPEARTEFTANELNNLVSYQRLEDTAVGFASLYAQGEWGDDVSMVEVRMRRDAIIPFEQRHDDAAEKTETFTLIGWRSVMPFDEETRNAWL